MINFVHVGLHKTGTTWLQQVVFPSHPGLSVIASPDPLYAGLFRDLRMKSPAEFDLSKWRQEFESRTEKQPPSGRIFGISWETFSGNLLYSRIPELVADRLLAVFGPIKILLVLRHPVPFINSIHNQHMRYGRKGRGGPALTMKEFVNLKDAEDLLVLKKVDYRNLIAVYQSRFGSENLCVLPFELLVKSPADFLERIWSFIGVSSIPTQQLSMARKNESYTRVAIDVMRFLDNHGLEIRPLIPYIKRIDRVLFRHFSSPPRFTGEQICQYQPAFLDLFVDSNYAFWNGDLAKFNYRFNWH